MGHLLEFFLAVGFFADIISTNRNWAISSTNHGARSWFWTFRIWFWSIWCWDSCTWIWSRFFIGRFTIAIRVIFLVLKILLLPKIVSVFAAKNQLNQGWVVIFDRPNRPHPLCVGLYRSRDFAQIFGISRRHPIYKILTLGEIRFPTFPLWPLTPSFLVRPPFAPFSPRRPGRVLPRGCWFESDSPSVSLKKWYV